LISRLSCVPAQRAASQSRIDFSSRLAAARGTPIASDVACACVRWIANSRASSGNVRSTARPITASEYHFNQYESTTVFFFSNQLLKSSYQDACLTLIVVFMVSRWQVFSICFISFYYWQFHALISALICYFI